MFFWDGFEPSFWSPKPIQIHTRSLRHIQGVPKRPRDRFWSFQEPPMSSILVPKIAPKPIQDCFDASESSPDSLKIDFGAPKTRPRRQEAAWGLQNGSQTDFRSLNTSPRRLYDQTNAFGFIFKRWARSSQLRRSNLAVHSSTFIANSSPS